MRTHAFYEHLFSIRATALLSLLLFPFFSFSATITSTATGGDFATGSTWIGGVAPVNGTTDDVVIATTGTGVVTLNGNYAIRSLLVNVNSHLNINGAAVTLTVQRAACLCVPPTSTNNGTIDGTGNLAIGTWQTSFTNSSTGVVSLRNYSCVLITINAGSFTTSNDINCGGNFTNSASTSVLNIGGTSTFSASLFANAVGNTVNYTGAAQNVRGSATGYYHLTLSGSGTKTLTTLSPPVAGNLSIEGTASFNVSTNSLDLTVGGDWIVTSLAADPFVQGTRRVTLNGAGIQNISTVLAGGETFYNLTINSTGPVVLGASTDVTVTNDLVLTAGLIDVNGRTFTLGASGSASTFTAAATTWFYGGTFRRWWRNGTTVTAAGSPNYGLFPMGTSSASTYRPVVLTSSGNVTADVSFSVNHVDAITITDFGAVSDGGTNVTRKSDAQFITALSGGTGAATFTVGVTMTGLNSTGTLTDNRIGCNAGASISFVGTHVVPTAVSAANPVLTRTGVTSANLLANNDFRVVSSNPANTPLRKIFYSRNGGGNWNNAATWSTSACNGVAAGSAPASTDDVQICSGDIVTVNAVSSIVSVTIKSGGTLNGSSNLTVSTDMVTQGTGVFTNTGGTWAVTRDVTTAGTGSSSAVTFNVSGDLDVGSGTNLAITTTCTVAGNLAVNGTLAMGASGLAYTGSAKTFNGTGSITGNGTITVPTAKTILAGTNITINPVFAITAAVTITNNGTVTLNNNLTGSAAGSTWRNNAGTTLNITGDLLTTGTLDASAVNNLVNYNGTTQAVKGSTYADLTIGNSGVKTIGAATTVYETLAISGSATLASGAFQITGNLTAPFTMAAGTTLTLGSTGSATNIFFPTNFSTGNISLNATSSVVYQSTAAQTVSSVPVYGGLSIQTSGTKTADGNLTVNGALSLGGSATLASGGFTHTVSGATTISGTAVLNTDNAAGVFNLQSLSMTGGSVAGSATGTVKVGTTFTVPSGTATIGQCTYSVTATTTVSGDLTFSSDVGVKTFTGAVSVTAGDNWVSTTVVTPGNMIFKNGIASSGTQFSCGGATFNANNQSLSGGTSISFNSPVIVTGVTVTNNATVIMTNTSAGTLSGTGSWTQGASSDLYYRGQTITISSMDASASGNLVEYDRLGVQTVFNTASGIYWHLNFGASAGSHTKTLASNIDINGDLLIKEGASFDASTFDFTLAGNWTNTSTHADPFVQQTRSVTFDGGGTQTITNTNDETYYNLIVNKAGGTVDLAALTDVFVTNAITLTAGVVSTAANILHHTNTTAANLTHTSGFVNGNLRRYLASNTSTYDFPLGNGTASTDRHRMSILNNSLLGIIYVTGFVSDLSQGAANVDANLSTTQGGTPVTTTSGEAAGQTVIWTLTPDAVPSGGTYGVRLYVENTTLTASEDDKFCPLKRNTGSVTYADFLSYESLPTTIPSATGPGRIYSAGAGYAERNGYTTFSEHVIGVGLYPLPVELLSFDAEPDGEVVDITWSTASEFNSAHFIVQRSQDGVVFENVAQVNAAGNSSVVKRYTSIDSEPHSGISYYRLKQVDLDGKFALSNMVAVNLNGANTLLVFPNPAAGPFHVSYTGQKGEKVLVVVRDVLGKEYYSDVFLLSSGAEVIAIDPTGKLASGVYIITASSNDKIFEKKIVIR